MILWQSLTGREDQAIVACTGSCICILKAVKALLQPADLDMLPLDNNVPSTVHSDCNRWTGEEIGMLFMLEPPDS